MYLMRLSSTMVLASLLLAGCSTPAAQKQAATTKAFTDGRCHSEAAQFTVGQQITAELIQQAQARSGAQMARGLKPDDMVTLDYRSDRLNLNTDANGRISSASCG